MVKLKIPPEASAMATKKEQEWLDWRLGMFSEREKLIMNQAMEQLTPPKTAGDLINLTYWLEDFSLWYPAHDDAELGQRIAAQEWVKPDALPFLDFAALGGNHRAQHPGEFSPDGGYVEYPETPCPTPYDGTNLDELNDIDYSLKLKLSSADCPQGVWLRLPDRAETIDRPPSEIALALHSLGANSLEDCTMVKGVCALNCVPDPTCEYLSVEQLVRDAENLGHVLDERGQGAPHWIEHLFAALQLEQCDSLPLALDISQNLRCYDFLPDQAALAEFGRQAALEDRLFHSDSESAAAFDFEAYGRLRALEAGMLQADVGGYIRRNTEPFHHEHTQAPIQPQMSELTF